MPREAKPINGEAPDISIGSFIGWVGLIVTIAILGTLSWIALDRRWTEVSPHEHPFEECLAAPAKKTEVLA